MTRRGRGRPPHPDILTPAEWRVLEELRTGGTYAEIAVRLGVSPDAIRFHVRNMRAKLNLRDRAELVAWTPPDGERRRSFRALLAPLAALPFATRTIARVAAAVVLAAGVLAVLALVVVLRNGDAEPPPPVAQSEAAPTPVPLATCEYNPLAVGGVMGALDSRHQGGFPAPTHLVNELRALARYGHFSAEPEAFAPEAVVAIGSVRDVRVLGQDGLRTEDLREGVLYPRDVYVGFKVELREVVHGQYAPGNELWIVLPSGSYFGLGDEEPGERFERSLLSAARNSLLCSDVFFAVPGQVFESVTLGEGSGLGGPFYRGYFLWSVFVPRGQGSLSEYVDFYHEARANVQYKECPFFSGMNQIYERSFAKFGISREMESDAIAVDDAIAFSDAIVFGTIASIDARGVAVVHVDETVYGELEAGSSLRVSLPIRLASDSAGSGSLPCSGGLFVLKAVRLVPGSGPVYGLVDEGFYLESDAGYVTSPLQDPEWSYLGAHGRVVPYGVAIEDKTVGELADALRGGIGTTCLAGPEDSLLYPLSRWNSEVSTVWARPNLLEDADLVLVGTMVSGEETGANYLVSVDVKDVLHSRRGIAPDRVQVLFGWNGPTWRPADAEAPLPREDFLLVLHEIDVSEGPVRTLRVGGPVYTLFEYWYEFLPEGFVARRTDGGFKTMWMYGRSPRAAMEAWGLDTCTSFDGLVLAVRDAFAAVE